ncbi:hypothetical protein HMN09_00216300 [Mycena chlorophos]|uniref:Uncharacterized protein n=1 Tax=Mycena chlorophos TaxID=658473 RepID=A0A8H6TJR4_MYCCL|nr:hypothetical protein HMN09_00216300 [Mycena chlorophos]
MELARRPPHPRSALTTVELSVAIRRPLTIAVPGRTLENAYTRLGNVAERQANKLAHAFGRGPLAAHEHIERFMGVYSACEAKLEEINKKPPEELQRYCSRLLEYAFPTKSAVTQMDCFKCIVSLITRYAGFRAIFLGCPRLGRLNPTSDELVQFWGRSDGFGTLQDFTFDLGFAAECLAERTVSVIVETALAKGPLWRLDVGPLGLNVIEQLIVSSGCEGTSKYSASLAIRYLGGIVARLSFWLQDGPVFDTTVTKLLVAADGLLKDLGIDSDAGAEETSPVDSDVEGIDLLCEAIVAGVLWRTSHQAPNRIVSSEHDWVDGFTNFVTLLRYPRAEDTLPFAWECATNEEMNRLQPVLYSSKEWETFELESLDSPSLTYSPSPSRQRDRREPHPSTKMTSTPPNLSQMARPKLSRAPAKDRKDSFSLQRWVLLKNYIIQTISPSSKTSMRHAKSPQSKSPSPSASQDSRLLDSNALAETASAPEHPSTPPATPPRTSSPSEPVRDRLFAAISKLESTRQAELTDQLMSLSKRERAMCLFNVEVLRAKIADAKLVLESGEDNASSKEIMPNTPRPKKTANPTSPPTTPNATVSSSRRTVELH